VEEGAFASYVAVGSHAAPVSDVKVRKRRTRYKSGLVPCNAPGGTWKLVLGRKKRKRREKA
jgi:hypothetical protein